jgi:prevent-host-death family protein
MGTEGGGLREESFESFPPVTHLRRTPCLVDSDFDELYSLANLTGEFMDDSIIVTALDARANFGKLLRRVEDEGRSLVIEKRGSPRAVLLSIRDYVRLAVPEPEVLRIIGKESKQKGTNKLNSRQIDQIVKAARRSKSR